MNDTVVYYIIFYYYLFTASSNLFNIQLNSRVSIVPDSLESSILHTRFHIPFLLGSCSSHCVHKKNQTSIVSTNIYLHTLVEKDGRAAVKTALRAAFLASSPSQWTATFHNEGLRFWVSNATLLCTKGCHFDHNRNPFDQKKIIFFCLLKIMSFRVSWYNNIC